jgi:TPR repeat protein
MTRKSLLGLVFALLMAFAPPVAASVKEAEAAIAAGRYAEAVSILKPLVSAGDRDAQTLMGGLLLAGLGVEKNLVSARDMFTYAANQGQPFAQYNLAVMYHSGDAGGVDSVAARHWYSMSAEGGFVPAMTQWAIFMADGQGGPRDVVNARRWAERAANAGDGSGLYLLGVMTANGQGGTPDLTQAYVWLLLADQSGFKPAKETIETLKHRLTADERTKAEQAAAAWRPTAEGTVRR